MRSSHEGAVSLRPTAFQLLWPRALLLPLLLTPPTLIAWPAAQLIATEGWRPSGLEIAAAGVGAALPLVLMLLAEEG